MALPYLKLHNCLMVLITAAIINVACVGPVTQEESLRAIHNIVGRAEQGDRVRIYLKDTSIIDIFYISGDNDLITGTRIELFEGGSIDTKEIVKIPYLDIETVNNLSKEIRGI